MHLLPEGSDKFLYVPSQINNIQRVPVKRWGSTHGISRQSLHRVVTHPQMQPSHNKRKIAPPV